ncbi:MAG: glycosyltransferase, partial [Sediminibacterium sp.]
MIALRKIHNELVIDETQTFCGRIIKFMVTVFLVCSGLGNVQRGYESFTQECFEALERETHTSIEVFLFKGGGKSQNKEFVLPNLPRASWLAKKLGKILEKDSYFIEQFTFALSLLTYIYLKRPHVIFFSDFSVGTTLWHCRRMTGLPYKLIFCNGASYGPPFSRTDFVQHSTPVHYQMALDAGESPSKHFLIPQGIEIIDQLKILSQEERFSLGHALELPSDRPIILSVAAIDKTVKRIDYLISEVAQLSEPRPFLIMLGHQTTESPEIVNMGKQLLGKENFLIKTVPMSEVTKYYQVADIFVLTSLKEGFGRVFVEAMSYGLPCIAHDYDVARFVLKDEGYFGNFELPGSLAS